MVYLCSRLHSLGGRDGRKYNRPHVRPADCASGPYSPHPSRGIFVYTSPARRPRNAFEVPVEPGWALPKGDWEFMEIQSATVTRMVIRMERAGFVERRTDPDDQRVSRVYLTERGRSLQPAVEQGWMALEQQILADFSLEERLLLRRFLEQIYRNLS